LGVEFQQKQSLLS